MERYLNILFAAVQLASHTSTLELLDVVDFVDALKPYVSRIIRNLHLQRELYKANGSRRLWFPFADLPKHYTPTRPTNVYVPTKQFIPDIFKAKKYGIF